MAAGEQRAVVVDAASELEDVAAEAFSVGDVWSAGEAAGAAVVGVCGEVVAGVCGGEFGGVEMQVCDGFDCGWGFAAEGVEGDHHHENENRDCFHC